jgi:hypothetical protein
MPFTAEDARACDHESAHVAVALRLGWPVEEALRRKDGSGLTRTDPRKDGDLNRRALEAAAIAWAGLLAVLSSHSPVDQQLLRDAAAAGVSLVKAYDLAQRILRETSAERGGVSDALMYSPNLYSPNLDGAEILIAYYGLSVSGD